jgi:formylglycine-generating enzyme required for sulfatase activity/FKBP-type peptidyl-prolyl cis-trans isomerase
LAVQPQTGSSFTNLFNMEMIWVPPGQFVMGSPTNECDRTDVEGPQTTVTLSMGFWLGKYEVTQAQWTTLMTNNPSFCKGDPRLPVESVTWNEANEFCQKLTERAKSAGELPVGFEYRLPTEAQWEYACRAGTKTRFSHGDDLDYKHLDEYAWHYNNGDHRTHPVGKKRPNPWGFYDMHGNVWEWCLDRRYPYPGGHAIDPENLEQGGIRVFRGGGRTSFPSILRSANRGADLPESRASGLGLRVALASRSPQFGSDAEKVSYAIGVIFGLGLRGDHRDLDAAAVAQGLKDAYTDTNSMRLSGPQARATFDAHEELKRLQKSEQQKSVAEKNHRASDDFLLENAKRVTVKTLASGLQYEILRPAEGEVARPNDTVTVHFRGQTIGGKEFVNTWEEHMPQTLPLDLSYLPPGLREALNLMPVGSRWKIFVPSNLAFPLGHPGQIEPGAALIYELELLFKRPTSEFIEEERQRELVRNRKLGREFLANMAKENAVHVLPSGLQYRVIADSAGTKPLTNALVDVRWRVGTLDGLELFNNLSDPVPMTLDLGKVRSTLNGVFEALLLMSPGSRWSLAIPDQLGYAPTERRSKIPPGSTLLAELELVAIKSTGATNNLVPLGGRSP